MAIVPAIRVVIGKGEYGRESLAEAHFAIRRGCYNYLRWRDGSIVKELYLGRVRQRATQGSSPAPAAAIGIRRKLCGKKKPFKTFKCFYCSAVFGTDAGRVIHMTGEHSDDLD